jgi:Selenocysteine lyase
MIYLDNAATSYPKAPGVSAAVAAAIDEPLGNAGRASSIAGLGAARVAFEAREALSALLGAPDSSRLVFTKNATEALNLVIRGFVPRGGLVAMSSLEHNSVARPVRRLELEEGASCIVFSCDERGRPDPEELRSALRARPSLLIVTAASNVSGAILPFEDIVADCRREGVPVLVDGSQAVGHINITLGELGASAFCFSGHKGLLGPEGTGCAYLAPGFEPEPLIWGGTGSDSASLEQPRGLPEGYEAGTQNAPALAGLRAAADYLAATGIDAITQREADLRDRLRAGISALPRAHVRGPEQGERCVPIVSFTAEGIDPGALALALGRRGIACRPGLHCSPLAHRGLGTLESGGTLRLSPGYFSAEAEIDECLAALEELLA